MTPTSAGRLAFALSMALLAATAGCSHGTHSGRAPAPAAPAVAVPADDNLNSVLWMQRSAEYAALTTGIYRAAAARLDQALAQADWDALAADERQADADYPTASARRQLPPAVILDIDETVLDNSPYQARMVLDGSEYADRSWDQWVAEKKAKALPGMRKFAAAAEARGVTLLYISNRAMHLQQATLANLRAEGLPVKDDSVFLGMGMQVEGCHQERASDKHCRRAWAGRHYRVLMQFGDQLGDFVRIAPNTGEARAATLQRHRDWFGERWWMLPNPTYGSWEPALFDNDWTRPRDERRRRKRQALDAAR